jgi:hypothetical protein
VLRLLSERQALRLSPTDRVLSTATTALKVLGLAVGLGTLIGLVAHGSGEAGWAVFALLVLSAVVVAIAQQTLP